VVCDPESGTEIGTSALNSLRIPQMRFDCNESQADDTLFLRGPSAAFQIADIVASQTFCSKVLALISLEVLRAKDSCESQARYRPLAAGAHEMKRPGSWRLDPG